MNTHFQPERASARELITRAQLPLCFALLVCGMVLAGCKSASPSQYISPRVEGRVLDSRSGQPMKNVQVLRGTGEKSYNRREPAKGAVLMQESPTVRTAADGTFVLESERDLTFLRKLGWYAITLTFRHPDYETMRKTYTLSNSTNTASGEPLVRTGDILLKPLSR